MSRKAQKCGVSQDGKNSASRTSNTVPGSSGSAPSGSGSVPIPLCNGSVASGSAPTPVRDGSAPTIPTLHPLEQCSEDPLVQTINTTCNNCFMRVIGSEALGHLHFGRLHCTDCAFVISSCENFKLCYPSKLQCRKTKKNHNLNLWEQPIERHLIYFAKRNSTITNFLGDDHDDSEEESVSAILSFLRSIHALKDKEPWKTAFDDPGLEKYLRDIDVITPPLVENGRRQLPPTTTTATATTMTVTSQTNKETNTRNERNGKNCIRTGPISPNSNIKHNLRHNQSIKTPEMSIERKYTVKHTPTHTPSSTGTQATQTLAHMHTQTHSTQTPEIKIPKKEENHIDEKPTTSSFDTNTTVPTHKQTNTKMKLKSSPEKRRFKEDTTQTQTNTELNKLPASPRKQKSRHEKRKLQEDKNTTETNAKKMKNNKIKKENRTSAAQLSKEEEIYKQKEEKRKKLMLYYSKFIPENVFKSGYYIVQSCDDVISEECPNCYSTFYDKMCNVNLTTYVIDWVCPHCKLYVYVVREETLQKAMQGSLEKK